MKNFIDRLCNTIDNGEFSNDKMDRSEIMIVERDYDRYKKYLDRLVKYGHLSYFMKVKFLTKFINMEHEIALIENAKIDENIPSKAELLLRELGFILKEEDHLSVTYCNESESHSDKHCIHFVYSDHTFNPPELSVILWEGWEDTIILNEELLKVVVLRFNEIKEELKNVKIR